MLAGFLGSRITCTVGLFRKTLHTIGLQLGEWICLPPSAPLPFNVLFRQHAALSLLRHHFALQASTGILTRSSIGYAFRLRLRDRLTLIRLALIRKPWSFGEGVSRPLYRYLYLHLLFHKLQYGSHHTFQAGGMLPYRWSCDHPKASAECLCPIIIHAKLLD